MRVDNLNLDFEGLRVLVVDDEPTIIKMVATVLRALGISQIRAAADGQAALALFNDPEFPFDLVICDWMMPATSGIEVLKEIRTQDTTIPFLMLTSNVTKEAIVEARDAGVSGYVAKPFSSEELAKKVRTLAKQSLSGERGVAWRGPRA